MRRLAILIVLSAFPSTSELLPIRTYRTADGLAADKVFCVVADSRGFLWFCTPEGLSRFDGTRFVNYGVDEGLPHPMVNTLIETRSGEHWIGTPRGLSRITTSDKGPRFTNYRLGPEDDANSILAIREARSGKFWVGARGGLFDWTGPLRFRRIEFPAPPQLIGCLVEDAGGNPWIGTTSGIYVYGESGVVQRFTTKDGLPGEWIEDMLWDSRGRLWVALRGGLALISRRATGTWSVEKAYTAKSGLISGGVAALAEASDGTLWVGTNNGISRLRLDADEPPVIQNMTRAQGLSDRSIYSLGEDQAGNMWAGTEGAGVMRIGGLGFTTYREPDGLSTDRVLSVLQDRAGELLAVTVTNKGRSVSAII